MKSGVWIVEYWSELYGKWIPCTCIGHYGLKWQAKKEKKDEQSIYPKKKLRVQKYIRAEPKAKKGR